MKTSTAFFIFLLTLCHTVLAEDLSRCDAPHPAYLQARYSITQAHTNASDTLIVTRNAGRVAHTHAHSNISDVWFQHRNHRVALVRYFDEHKRGIEYEPFDLQKNNGNIDWGSKYQLISEKTFKKLSLVSEGKIGCDKLEIYQGKINGFTLHLEWLPEWQLLKLFTASKDGVFQSVSLLEKNTDKTIADRFFKERDGFQLTDYTDIGDNESDPFLLSMINLGFVEHGAEGFYDANGNKMGAQHGHHH